jgi:hypothetical protein
MNHSSGRYRVNRKEIKKRQPARTMTKAEYSSIFWSGCDSAELISDLASKGFINVENLSEE